MEEPSFLSRDALSQPEYPASFQLLGTPVPLAGPEDTYWIAQASWVEGGYEGFLIYADATHYLFLDQKESHTTAVVLRSALGLDQTKQASVSDHEAVVNVGSVSSARQRTTKLSRFAAFPLRLLRHEWKQQVLLVL
jgi:hypothetical protein